MPDEQQELWINDERTILVTIWTLADGTRKAQIATRPPGGQHIVWGPPTPLVLEPPS